MDPISIGITAATALLGRILAGKDEAEAARLMALARDEFGRISPAKVKALAMDAQSEAAMTDSLSRMDEAVQSRGMTVGDRASINDALDATGRQERGFRAHLMRRYGPNSSQAVLAGLVNQQGQAERAQSAGLQSARDAQARYWEAVRSRFGMGDRLNDARTAIDRWNNANEQQRFDNDIRIASGKAGINQTMAGQKQGAADRTSGSFAAAGDYLGQAYSQYQKDKERRDSLAGPGYGYGY